MMGLKFMGEAPFGDVYIHALVRDQEGQKMSKSKGNAIDPLDIMARYGTDAFRFTLASMAAMGRDIKLAEERIAGCQSFVNKAWNAARFVLTHVERHPAAEKAGGAELAELRDADLNLADRWILSRLAATVAGVREAIDSYRFNDAAHIVYQFTWHEFCDWYVEMSKLSLNGVIGDDPVKTTRVLAGVLREVLLLLHPIMPFVTEELWSHLSPGSGSIMVKPYPESRLERREPAVEQRVAYLMDIIRSIRNLRTEMNVQPSAEVAVSLFAPGPDLDFLKRHEPYIKALARAGAINYASDGQRPKGAATAVVGATEVYLPVADLTNLEEERKRLTKEVGKAEDELERIYRKLKNDDFLKKARAEIVLKEKEKASRYEEQLRTLQRSLRRIEEIGEHGGG
jgi:valyl-tRNA synthetase